MQETGKELLCTLRCLALFFLGPLRSDGNGGYVAAKTALRSSGHRTAALLLPLTALRHSEKLCASWGADGLT